MTDVATECVRIQKTLIQWKKMLDHPEKLPEHLRLKEVTLEPGSFLPSRQIETKWQYKYFPEDPERLFPTIADSTLFWYPAKAHKYFPHVLYKGEQREIAGVFLKKVIPQSLQDEVYAVMEQMWWRAPGRPETKTAEDRQKGNIVTPRELTLGLSKARHEKSARLSANTKKQHEEHLQVLFKLTNHMTACFARVLPNYFGMQNSSGVVHLNPERRTPAGPGEKATGIQDWMRFGLSSFSTITLLRSCPASVHKDKNARRNLHNFACFTSLGSGFKGGRLCFLEYGIKIPVGPGDMFIAQSSREWHYNVDPVVGTKYSVICYYQPRHQESEEQQKVRRRAVEDQYEKENLGAAGGDSP